MAELQDVAEVQVDITSEDVRAAMQASPVVALQVRNQALVRMIRELQAELAKVKAAYVASAPPGRGSPARVLDHTTGYTSEKLGLISD
jgi:hypothetical protein